MASPSLLYLRGGPLAALRTWSAVLKIAPAASSIQSASLTTATSTRQRGLRAANSRSARYDTLNTFYPVRHYSQLAEVGRLEPLKLEGNYDTGQMFLHRLFGYRGVVLFPWTARVYDRDAPSSNNGSKMKHNPPPALDPHTANNPLFAAQHQHDSSTHHTVSGNPASGGGAAKEVKGKTHTYYQVLIDSRDCPFITHRAQTESVTFLGNHSENTRNLYAIPGLDYVGHEDVLPYSTSDAAPIQHELFDKFLHMHNDNTDNEMTTWGAQDTLRAWQEKNHPWLELSDVHRETTENIRVTVIPFYMGYRENQQNNVYWWRYCIRLENLGTQAVQLRERNWRIFSLSGTLETVRGRGVVGQEPLLTRDQPAFQYSSHVSLQAPSGHMWGTFRMEREDGYSFDCRIPPFSLESKQEASPPDSTGGDGPGGPPTEPFDYRRD